MDRTDIRHHFSSAFRRATTWEKIAGRFCLSFFITEKCTQFFHVLRFPGDPYLGFGFLWVPIFGKFSKNTNENRTIRQHTKRKEQISTERTVSAGASVFQIVEFFFEVGRNL